MRSVALFSAGWLLLLAVAISVTLVADLFVHGWTDTDPNFPAPADPQWIDWCDEAPSKP